MSQHVELQSPRNLLRNTYDAQELSIQSKRLEADLKLLFARWIMLVHTLSRKSAS